jgi:fucokinase
VQHGVYVMDRDGRVYTTLQKPSPEEIQAAGALLEDNTVALDTGLLCFDANVAAKLTEMSDVPELPVFDLYQHVTQGLTGDWGVSPESAVIYRLLGDALRDVPFHCDLVEGEFIHIGTTRHFREVAAAAGGVIDSIVPADAQIGPGAVLVDCDLQVPLRVGRGAIVHGLNGFDTAIEIPDDVVVHQLPIVSSWGRPLHVFRVYGVGDDPKSTEHNGGITWFGRPVKEVFEDLGIQPDSAWPDVPESERSLWNANLFPVADLGTAWSAARWLLGYASDFRNAAAWLRSDRVSLESSIPRSDQKAIAEQRSRRGESLWRQTVVQLAEAGTDSRPLVANPPSLTAATQAARELMASAEKVAGDETAFAGGPHPLCAAASRYIHASNFFSRVGHGKEAAEAMQRGFACVANAVRLGIPQTAISQPRGWERSEVTVSAPVRMDLGGGWSDTPPFCFDWGGVVLNIAIELNERYPVETSIRRLPEPVLRYISEQTNESVEIRSSEELRRPAHPGDPAGICRIALQMLGLADEDDLRANLERRGGGLEVRSQVTLPVGSGLGTSSILAATVLRGLCELMGFTPENQQLLDQVMELEQAMTTGGGWQDQAGGIFPGAKLLSTGPGLRQRIRIGPVGWSPARQSEFCERLVLYDTGIQRIAKNLLQQVVKSYLAREVATVQVLHSIKTLATEMAWAMSEGDWTYLGQLLDRHWELNKVLDPNTTNAPINTLLRSVRPHITGAKLAGAGGGGFLIMLARDPDSASALRRELGEGVCSFRIANEGLRVAQDRSGNPIYSELHNHRN